MHLIDANLLLYAVNADAPQHANARAWLDQRLSSTEPVGFAWPSLVAFLRISTLSSLFPRPLSPATAKSKVDAWLAQPNVRIVQPTDDHWAIFGQLLVDCQSGGNLVTDAHLAALAFEHGATLCSTDMDFSRFPRLKWVNPLAGKAAGTSDSS